MGKAVLDDTRRGIIIGMIALGCSRHTAARFVGCAVATIRNTALRDDEFAASLRRAEHGLEYTQLMNIQAAGKRSWQASAWMLERRFPETYARRNPRLMTARQIGRLVTRFAEIVATEIADPADRARVLARLGELATGLERAGGAPRQERQDKESQP